MLGNNFCDLICFFSNFKLNIGRDFIGNCPHKLAGPIFCRYREYRPRSGTWSDDRLNTSPNLKTKDPLEKLFFWVQDQVNVLHFVVPHSHCINILQSKWIRQKLIYTYIRVGWVRPTPNKHFVVVPIILQISLHKVYSDKHTFPS